MKHPNIIPYREHVLTLIPYFKEITFEHIPREENWLADALATMSYMFNGHGCTQEKETNTTMPLKVILIAWN